MYFEVNWTARHMWSSTQSYRNDQKKNVWAEHGMYLFIWIGAHDCAHMYKCFVYIIAIHTCKQRKCNRTCNVQTDDSIKSNGIKRCATKRRMRIVWEPHVKNQWKSWSNRWCRTGCCQYYGSEFVACCLCRRLFLFWEKLSICSPNCMARCKNWHT